MLPLSIIQNDHADSEPMLRSRNVWMAVIGWLCLAGPLFVCMPLNSDTALYDVQARRVLDGGVAYRDIVEPNLPGALWVHVGIRTVLGWSSEVIRAVDLVVLLVVLALWSTLGRNSRRTLPVTVLAGTFFYLTRNEWCHAQRDMWMLLPAGLALQLRLRRSSELGFSSRSAFLEGTFWAIAFWIKPHVAVPGAAVIFVDLLCRRPTRTFGLKEILLVIGGGVAAAVPGIAWLIWTGAWDHFWLMMLEWNPEYLAAGKSRMSLLRWEFMARRFAPWAWLHLVGVPVAASTVILGVRNDMASSRSRVLLGSCYLAWLTQAVLLQHALDYIHVPAILLAIAVVASHPWNLPVGFRQCVAVGFLACSIAWTPFFQPTRIAQWPVVVSHGSTPDVRAALVHGNMPQWDSLSRVIQELEFLEARSGEVTCMNVHSVHIYNELRIHPSTRYWSVNILQELFPNRACDIAHDVVTSGHRYVVVEDIESGLTNVSQNQTWLDELEPIFLAGTYQVLRVPREQFAQRDTSSQ